MYYIETFNNDAFHKYVASMTGAVLQDAAPDDGAYMFDDKQACERAVASINKVYGIDNYPTVILRTVGEARNYVAPTTVAKESTPIKEKKEKISHEVKATVSAIDRIVMAMVEKAEKPSPTVATKQQDDVALSDIVKAISASTIKNNSANAATSRMDDTAEINIDDAENIGNDQYILDDNIDDFEVAPARPVARRR